MDNYLEHHGILGQKWGVRRYQNADGSLTSAGKKRYDYENSQGKMNAKSATAGFKTAAKLANSSNKKSRAAAEKIYSNAMKDYSHANSRNKKWNISNDDNTKKYLKNMEDAKRSAEKLFTKNDPISHYALSGPKYRIAKNGKKITDQILNNELKNKRYPFDEKPSKRQPWDEKLPDYKEDKHGHI